MSNQPKHHNHRWKWVRKPMESEAGRVFGWRSRELHAEDAPWFGKNVPGWIGCWFWGWWFGVQILGFKTMDCIFLLMCFLWLWFLCFCFGMKLWKVLRLQSQAAILVKSMRENTLKLVSFVEDWSRQTYVSIGIFKINDLRHTGKIQNEWRSMRFFDENWEPSDGSEAHFPGRSRQTCSEMMKMGRVYCPRCDKWVQLRL